MEPQFVHTKSYAVIFHTAREMFLAGDKLQGLAEGDGWLDAGGDCGQEGGETVRVGTLQAAAGELPQHAEVN